MPGLEQRILARFDTDEDWLLVPGDVLYLPPGVAHWGTAKRACMTYSIGMRAPEIADLAPALPDDREDNGFYTDPDLAIDETVPGYISERAAERARKLIADDGIPGEQTALTLGRCVTTTKQWLTPETVPRGDAERILAASGSGGCLKVHGMSRIAFDNEHAYVNGRSHRLPAAALPILERICRTRDLRGPVPGDPDVVALLLWMLETGAFEVSGKI